MFNRRSGPTSKRLVTIYATGLLSQRFDVVVGEEPLEIYISQGGYVSPFSVTMRTPGNDFELTTGLLYSEGFINNRKDIAELRYSCNGPEGQDYNVMIAHLREVRRELENSKRATIMSSACGVCGKSSLSDLLNLGDKIEALFKVFFSRGLSNAG